MRMEDVEPDRIIDRFIVLFEGILKKVHLSFVMGSEEPGGDVEGENGEGVIQDRRIRVVGGGKDEVEVVESVLKFERADSSLEFLDPAVPELDPSTGCPTGAVVAFDPDDSPGLALADLSGGRGSEDARGNLARVVVELPVVGLGYLARHRSTVCIAARRPPVRSLLLVLLVRLPCL